MLIFAGLGFKGDDHRITRVSGTQWIDIFETLISITLYYAPSKKSIYQIITYRDFSFEQT